MDGLRYKNAQKLTTIAGLTNCNKVHNSLIILEATVEQKWSCFE